MKKGITAARPNLYSVPTRKQSDMMESEKQTEESIMPQETYTKSEIDLKFDKISTDIHHGFEKVDLKFDNFERRIENMLLVQENRRLEEQAKNKKEFMYWAIGIIVALAGIAFPIWFGK
ncbi:hypothetical protein [Streptococcus suis]|uniref:hypothetical protein n=1 Tax=Streptococcus suis TaxID=1307 RepID=UPI000429FBA2|nr:hypothetical protein [Streptococcus suis]MCQ9224017.1 hypothetical protein [Streptococcus suis]MCQ9230704.1 hypothetical protein [Streptococcus suis]UUM24080.1 hypothetical protein NQZ84_03835 [Streptococcus suis]CYU92392.1 Uncharacterised protein [Streptococcus suis]CYV09862.1 Uncharacterised protein [Streptococcus suis]